jgi:hypothetical protein
MHIADPRGRSYAALYLFRRAARLSRRKRSARRGEQRWPLANADFILQNANFPAAARCAVVATKAQRAIYAAPPIISRS